MFGNFDFLKYKEVFKNFANPCIEAEKSIGVSPATSAIQSRRALELAVKWLYSVDKDLRLPYQDNLSSLIHEYTFRDIVDVHLFQPLKYIIKLGNVAVHTNSNISRDEAILSLRNLHEFIMWIDYCYADEHTEKVFEENLVPTGEDKRTRPEELKDLYEKISSKDKDIEDLRREYEKLRLQLSEKRVENTTNYDFIVDEQSEKETRERYIDVELKLSGWEIGRDVLVEFELDNMPRESKKGFVDYVLFGSNGKPLAIIEAKRTKKDPNEGLQQAKIYSDCLEKKYNQRPIIFNTNGFDTYIWDDFEGYPQRRVNGIFTKDELQLKIDRRTSKKSLEVINIKDEISNRYYQKEAITRVCDAISKKQRKMLLVMATGSGKTRTAISVVDVLTTHNYVKNILFLADRKALVRQAKKNFNTLLPNLSLCNLLDNKDNPESARMIFSTYPTMLNAIDDTKTKDGKKLFTPGHFDLIIVDESHRSIYKKYKDIFDYFDAMLIGLTATPKDEIDKNTYTIFDLENGVPTYAYELEKAVEDEYLVDYNTLEVKSKIMEEGINYDQLSNEEKEEFENTFDDDENIDNHINEGAINEWLFNANTIDLVLNKLMDHGIKVEGGDKLGKTILFAKNQKHARAICDRFNTIYPEYGGSFARVIDYSVSHVDTLIDEFSTKEKQPQIAISVDMLDTGIDIPEVVNLVFFKKVRSKSKFWQMIGRGTRLCEDLFGVGMDKEKFLIFDFCNNFEFFRANPKGYETKIGTSLTESIFNNKIDIIRELQNIQYHEDDYTNYRNELLEDIMDSVNNLNEESFRVKMNLRFVHKYKNKDEWQTLDANKINEIKENISPLIAPINDDELAKRFDNLLYTIKLAELQNNNASKPIRSVIETAESLSQLGTIPQVVEQKYIIEKVMTEEFWEEVDIFDLEEVRISLRDLIKFIELKSQKIYYTNFSDEIIEVAENDAMYDVNDLKNYKKKVEHYLKKHKDELAIYKLRNNKKLTKQDLESLETLMWEKLGSKDDYIREYGDTPVNKLVRRIVGLDRNTANEVFSVFLSEEKLNVNQIKFVRLIVDYVVKNGMIEDNRVLQEEPFRSVGSIVALFKDNMSDAQSLMGVLNEIRTNSEEIM